MTTDDKTDAFVPPHWSGLSVSGKPVETLEEAKEAHAARMFDIDMAEAYSLAVEILSKSGCVNLKEFVSRYVETDTVPVDLLPTWTRFVELAGTVIR